jgi:hypothetical protein
MLHGRRGDLVGPEAFFGSGNGQAAPLYGASLAADEFCFQPSLSRKLAAFQVFRRRNRIVTRFASASLSEPEKFTVGTPRAISTRLVLEADPTKAGQWAQKFDNAVLTEQLSCVQA